MTSPNQTWTVKPHGEITTLDDGLYTVTGKLEMPLGETIRRMTLVRTRDGRLVVWSAISLGETAMQQLEAIGRPAWIVVPSGIHRMDLKPWKSRYPDARVVGPAGAKKKIEELVELDDTELQLDGGAIRVTPVPGTGAKELSMLVDVAGKKTLVVNDLVFNLPDLGGIRQVLYQLAGFGPGHAHQPALVKHGLVEDDGAMRAQLRTWAELPGLRRLLPGHGDVIDEPQEALRRLAAA